MPTVASLRDMAGDNRIESERAPDGKPDGVIFGVPELEHATDEEKHAFLRRLIEHEEEVVPRGAKGPTFAAPAAPLDPQTAAEAQNVFRPTLPVERPTPPEDAELFDADLLLYDPGSYRVEPLTVQGKRVWVHPTSFEERLEITKRALSDMKRGGYLPTEPAETREEAARLELERRAATVAFTQLHQAMRCARQGPEPAAARIFQDKHLDALRRNPGWGEAIEAIAELSNQLSEGATEAQQLKEMLRDFFGRVQNVLGISSSKLISAYGEGEAMPAPVREVLDFLDDFGDSVSALRRPGKPWGSRELQGLALVLGYGEDAAAAEGGE